MEFTQVVQNRYSCKMCIRDSSQTAAQIAIRTVRTFLRKNDEPLKVVFNVFRDHDARLYRAGLGCAEEEDNR